MLPETGRPSVFMTRALKINTFTIHDFGYLYKTESPYPFSLLLKSRKTEDIVTICELFHTLYVRYKLHV